MCKGLLFLELAQCIKAADGGAVCARFGHQSCENLSKRQCNESLSTGILAGVLAALHKEVELFCGLYVDEPFPRQEGGRVAAGFRAAARRCASQAAGRR